MVNTVPNTVADDLFPQSVREQFWADAELISTPNLFDLNDPRGQARMATGFYGDGVDSNNIAAANSPYSKNGNNKEKEKQQTIQRAAQQVNVTSEFQNISESFTDFGENLGRSLSQEAGFTVSKQRVMETLTPEFKSLETNNESNNENLDNTGSNDENFLGSKMPDIQDESVIKTLTPEFESIETNNESKNENLNNTDSNDKNLSTSNTPAIQETELNETTFENGNYNLTTTSPRLTSASKLDGGSLESDVDLGLEFNHTASQISPTPDTPAIVAPANTVSINDPLYNNNNINSPGMPS